MILSGPAMEVSGPGYLRPHYARGALTCSDEDDISECDLSSSDVGSAHDPLLCIDCTEMSVVLHS